MELPLFETWPALRERIPYEPIALLPTPVERMERLSGELGCSLYIKRDDQTGALYGGNKVRKLGFLLASAKADGAKTVLTFGAAGSNHALATAIYAREMGLRAVSMLVPQPNAHSVQRNLLRHHLAGAELHHHGGLAQVAAATCVQFAKHSAMEGQFPRVIPTGGSSPLGLLGFVNAAFELKQQVEAGAMPMPDVIYAASGTMGTAIGLTLGLTLAGMPTRVECIRVTAARFTNMARASKLFDSTARLLRENGVPMPEMPLERANFRLRDEFYGEQYALYTEQGMAALHRLYDAEGIKLEGTYTAKAFAALLADAESGALEGKNALFWLTYNGVDFSDLIADADYHALPPAFHRYFEEPVQPLDR
ncbi:MAG: pyridoxal-phosphate dependent enzyme [Candidatus Hydrogenedens sp.]|nr:pyridoxal-phosphate dependent enzyme [Candidatus Hydrogenedens sp.]